MYSMYLERTFLVRTEVVGLEYVYKKHKKSTYRLQFVTLVIALEQDNSLVSYTVCPICYLVLPLTVASRRETTTTTTTTTKDLLSYLFNVLHCLTTTAIIYPPLSLPLPIFPYSLSTSFLHALLSRTLPGSLTYKHKLILSPPNAKERH